MLFNLTKNGEVFDIPEKEMSEMGKKFPNFETNFLELRFKDVYASKVPVTTDAKPNEESATFMAVEYPKPISYKAKGKVKVGNTEHEIQYSESSPTFGSNGKAAFVLNAHILIDNGTRIEAGDWTKLYALEYLLGCVEGSKKDNGSAMFYYFTPNAQADNLIKEFEKESNAKILIYKESSDANILLAAKRYNLEDESVSVMRTALYDYYTGVNETTKNAIYTMLSSKSVSDDTEGLDLQDLLNKALNEEYIKLENGSFYKRALTGARGTYNKKPFNETNYSDDDEAKLSMITMMDESAAYVKEHFLDFMRKVDDKDAA